MKRCLRVPRKQTERASQSFSVSLTPLDVPEPGTKPALRRSTAWEAAGSRQMRGCAHPAAPRPLGHVGPLQGGWQDTAWASCSVRRANKMWPRVPVCARGGRWPGTRGVCRDSGGEKAQGQGDSSSASEVPGEGWLWDTGPDTGCCQRFWAHLASVPSESAQQRPSAHQALGKGGLGTDTGHRSGRCRPCAVPHCTALSSAAPSPTNPG